MATAIFPAIPNDIPAQAADTVRRSLVFDYDKAAFRVVDGALAECSGRDAVRGWIALMLRQKPGKVPIYRTGGSAQPGVDRSLIGLRIPDGFAQAEVERSIRETLAFCPAIREVDRFVFTRERRGLTVTFAVSLHSGESLEVSEFVDSK